MARPAVADTEPRVDGSSPLLGPGAVYASMARPVIRAQSRIGHKGQSRSCRPVAASTALARPVRHGPGAASTALARPVHRARSRSVTGHFCAGPLVSVCLALTLRWAETSPLLRWAKSLGRAGPYYAGPPRPYGSSLSLGAQSRVKERPRLRRAHDPRVFGPYFALGLDLTIFALGEVPRWRLRRSTNIGGIATAHGATARAARSTPASPPLDNAALYTADKEGVRQEFSQRRHFEWRSPRHRRRADSIAGGHPNASASTSGGTGHLLRLASEPQAAAHARAQQPRALRASINPSPHCT